MLVASIASIFSVTARKVAAVSFVCALSFCVTLWVVNRVAFHIKYAKP
jgi:hypothetical protein